MGNLKLKLLVVLTLAIFIYVADGTRHYLIIPQDLDGEAVAKVTDTELEDDVNYLLKIPLRLFPRVLCLENNNKVYSDGAEVSIKEFPEVGSMRLYVEKDGQQLIKPFDAPVGKILCEPINILLLEGATTTANYTQAGFIRVETDTDGFTKVIGAHLTDNGAFQANIIVDVLRTHLWVGLSPIASLFLLLFSFLGVSTITLALVELVKKILNFIRKDQFLKGF